MSIKNRGYLEYRVPLFSYFEYSQIYYILRFRYGITDLGKNYELSSIVAAYDFINLP